MTEIARQTAIFALDLAIERERRGSDLTPEQVIRFYERVRGMLEDVSP